MRLLGISGRANSGKTTFASVAVQEFGFAKIALADALKEEVADFLEECCVSFEYRNLYGTDLDKSEMFMVDLKDWAQADYRPRRVLNPHMVVLQEGDQVSMSFRKLLQLWGTEYRRAEDPEYWVKKTEEIIKQAELPVVIDDVRFEDEARMVQKLGGVLVRITRPGVRMMNHASEVALDEFKDFDWLVMNGESLEDYRNEVRRCLGVML